MGNIHTLSTFNHYDSLLQHWSDLQVELLVLYLTQGMLLRKQRCFALYNFDSISTVSVLMWFEVPDGPPVQRSIFKELFAARLSQEVRYCACQDYATAERSCRQHHYRREPRKLPRALAFAGGEYRLPPWFIASSTDVIQKVPASISSSPNRKEATIIEGRRLDCMLGKSLYSCAQLFVVMAAGLLVLVMIRDATQQSFRSPRREKEEKTGK